MKNIIDNKIQNGYSLDLGKIIENSFETYKKTFLISGVAFIIISIVIAILYAGYFGILYGFGNFAETMTQIESDTFDATTQIINTLIGSIFAGLFAPISAGFLYVNHLAKTNKEFGLSTFFDFYKSNKLKDIIINQLIITLTVNSIATFLVITNHEILAFLIQILIPLFTFFSIPLIIFGEQNYADALFKSAKLFVKQPFIIIVALLIGAIGAMVGIIALCIGIFFTFPYYFSVIYATYENGIGVNETSPIDEIGLE